MSRTTQAAISKSVCFWRGRKTGWLRIHATGRQPLDSPQHPRVIVNHKNEVDFQTSLTCPTNVLEPQNKFERNLFVKTVRTTVSLNRIARLSVREPSKNADALGKGHKFRQGLDLHFSITMWRWALIVTLGAA